MNFLKKACAVLVAGVLVSAGNVATAGNTQDANARVAFSDKLTMYSQRIASSACALTSPYAPFESKGFLGVAQTEINRILNALENGDAALGISGKEQNEAIRLQLVQMQQQWFPIEALAEKVNNGAPSATEMKSLKTYIGKFTETSTSLVSTISNQYASTEALTLGGAIRIQIAGRQRMLAQKLSYQSCTIQGDDALEHLVELAETMRIFERSASALRAGMPTVGLAPATEPELVSSLNKIDDMWSELKWPLLALQNGAQWDPITQKRMYLRLNELTHELDKSAIAFTKASQFSGS